MVDNTSSEQSSGTDVIMDIMGLSIDFDLPQGTLHAVKNVSFQLRSGKTLCLVGESGSGKSVTARSLMRIIDKPGRTTAGKILYHGENPPLDLVPLDPKGSRIRALRGSRIGLIFQEPMSALSPFHTIGDQIDEVIQLHERLSKEDARSRTVELLAQVEIPDPKTMAERYSFEFSGGMRQRVCIAMALACNPDILIADEPTTALDVTTQAEILDLIKRLQVERGMTMLLITHDMGIVAEVADEVAVMRHGSIVEIGTVDDIFHAPKSAYTRQLLEATLKLEGRAESKTEGTGNRSVLDIAPILSVKNISKHYGGTKRSLFGASTHALRAVDDVSIDLYPGENLGIVGESGSGKTTLGRLMLNIIDPTDGQVVYSPPRQAPINVFEMNKGQRRRFHSEVRLVFQDPFSSLNPRMTVRQIVGEPLYAHKLASGKAMEERVGELLDMVGLRPAMMDRYPHAFSGGQRQRIGIARALALEPKVIIADEATSALDVSIRSQVLDLLLELQTKLELSFIFISHDISVVRYFCDRVAVMRKGRLVEVGDADMICTNPTEAYTRALISAVPNPDPRHKRMLNRIREKT